MEELVEACKEGRLNDVKRLLEDEGSALDPRQRDEDGWTPLHYASQEGHLPVVEYLLEKGCNAGAEASDNRTTPLHLACGKGHVEVASRLLQARAPGELTLRKAKDGNTPLHFACRVGSVSVVKAILESTPDRGTACIVSTNGKGTTPLGIALSQAQSAAASNDVGYTAYFEVANLLLDRMTGNPAKRLRDFQAFFRSFNPRFSLSRPAKVFVIGDRRSGKSTLVRALKEESTIRNQFRGYALPKFIQDVDQHTVGVVPSDITSQSMDSRVILYDLAPGQAFTHRNLVNSVDDVATSVFIICIDMKEEEKRIVRAKLLYWMSFVHHQCEPHVTTQNKPSIIVAGRSFDMPRFRSVSDSLRLTGEYNEVASTEEVAQSLNLLDKFSLDFRKQGSIGLSDVRGLLKRQFQGVPGSREDGAASRLYILCTALEGEFPNSPAIQIRDLQAKISEESTQNFLLALLPESPEELLQLCQHLETSRRVVLKSTEGGSIEDTWIVHNDHQLLTEINDALCPPDSDLTGNSALMTREELQQCLSKIPVSFDILVQMMDYYRICEPITSEEQPDNQLFYIPALLPGDQDLLQWNDNRFVRFAWAFVPSAPAYLQFFMPRFLNFLLLRLYMFAKADKRLGEPSVWVEGICFSSENGTMDVCVVANAQGVILNMRCKEDQIECLSYRKKILEKIRSTKEEYQPDTMADEFVLTSESKVPLPLKDTQSPNLPKLGISELKNILEGQDPTLEPPPFLEPYSHLCKLPHATQHILIDPVSADQPVSAEAMEDLVDCFGQENWKSLVEHFKLIHDVDTSSTSTGASEETAE